MRGVFILKIILPAILVIVLFVVSFSLVFLPMVEKGFMDRKKEMIKELTNSAWSVVDEYYQEIGRENLSEEAAKEMAVTRIQFIRYGDESKDYFWITNMVPEMIMHPYRTDLNGRNVSDYTDPQGTRLFAEAVETVKKSGDGYIDYWWQWKDDSTRIVPKLSYVKAYEPWGWIVGTGIYLEDVKQEMKAIRGRLVRITILFVFLITITIFYITRQSLIIERSRIDAEEKLRHSKLKYKMLVESSAESTMMWLDDRLIYFNQPILKLTEYTEEELLQKGINELFVVQNGSVSDITKTSGQTRNIEAMLLTKSGKKTGVVLILSNIEINNKHGFILIIKELTRKLIRDKSIAAVQDDVKASILLMNSSVELFVREAGNVDMGLSLQEAADIMHRKQSELLFVTKNRKEIVGVLHKDVFIAEAMKLNPSQDTKVLSVMKSPVLYVKDNCLLFEALLLMDKQNTDYVAVHNANAKTNGFVLRKDLLAAQQNESYLLIKRIETSELIEQLRILYDKLPGILFMLLDANTHYRNVRQISSAVSDAITKRVIELAIEKTGPPPVGFAFISLGSEGREEQTLKTDQDNAIVFQGKNTKDVQEYFGELAENINKWLNDIGYEFCKGKIMASNPKWCQPVSRWKEYFREWVENSDPENILDTSIFFDMRFLYGDKTLVDELKDEIKKSTESKAVFFNNLAQSVQRTKAISFSDKQESLDLKKAMLPVVGFARVYALKYKIEETNTVERLKGIMQTDKFNKPFLQELVNAYEYLLFLRFRFQTQKIFSHENPDNLLPVEELTNMEKASLKAALSEIAELYTQLGFDFEGA
jgi:PAS domain S-box-containing protein